MKIEYVFDVISPYTAYATQFLRRYQPIWNFELKLRPVSLAGIMTLSGNKPPGLFRPKMKFMGSDLQLNNSLFDYQVDMPINFFAASLKTPFCQQIILASEELCYGQNKTYQILQEFTNAFLQSHEFRDKDNKLVIGEKGKLETDELNNIVNAVLNKCNIIGKQKQSLLELARSEEIKQKLESNTKTCVERGVYGAPTFFITDEEQGISEFMVFGSDRFEQIAHICKKPYYGANVQFKTGKL